MLCCRATEPVVEAEVDVEAGMDGSGDAVSDGKILLSCYSRT